jgi:hypothetical protein
LLDRWRQRCDAGGARFNGGLQRIAISVGAIADALKISVLLTRNVRNMPAPNRLWNIPTIATNVTIDHLNLASSILVYR